MKLSIEGKIRQDILYAALSVGRTGAHIAPSLSIVEICLAVIEEADTQDKIILSKGHGALGYYAAMHQERIITDEQFASFESDGGEFPGQPSRTGNNHIDYSSGSLGMGLSYGTGLAYANQDNRVFIILGDGEFDEGSNWEAVGLIARQKLNNVIAIVDSNGLQSDGRTQDIVGKNLEDIFKAYGWQVEKCDGHNIASIRDCINRTTDTPKVILANTIKGKGISFMENDNSWHHHELSQEDYDRAMTELGEQYGLC